MQKRIRDMIQEILSDENINIGFETDLIESEIMDSLMIAQLIAMIEDEYSISEIDIEDIVEDNFRTINAICNLLNKYGVSN